jgi:hypothetical protein
MKKSKTCADREPSAVKSKWAYGAILNGVILTAKTIFTVVKLAIRTYELIKSLWTDL